MKIRTDFVTNSSSSSFVTITVKLNDGSVIEQEYPMEDNGFNDSLYTLEEPEILELLSGHNTIGELLLKLDKFYNEMFLNGDEGTLDDIAFADIEEMTVVDDWDCDGDDAGTMIAKYTSSNGKWDIRSNGMWDIPCLPSDEEDKE